MTNNKREKPLRSDAISVTAPDRNANLSSLHVPLYPQPITASGQEITVEEFLLNPTNDPGLEWPRISVAVPTYKGGDLIERCLRSLILQNYPNLEILVFDAASPDQTAEIVEHYSDWIQVSSFEKDKGQSDALNKAFDRATGDVLTWLNNDDLHRPGALHAVAESWRENKSIDALYLARAHLVDIHQNLIHEQDYTTKNMRDLIDYRRDYIIQPGCFFSANIWRSAGPFEITLHYAFDFDFFYRATRDYPVFLIDHLAAYSVFHPDCKTWRDRAHSIIETGILQARYGAWDIAMRELMVIAQEHKFLETSFHDRKWADKPRILFAITEMNTGGAQTFLIRLVRDLSQYYKIYFSVFFEENVNEKLLNQLRPYARQLHGLSNLSPQMVAHLINELDIRLVHSHLFHADRFWASVCSFAKLPLIITDHGDYKVVEGYGITTGAEVKTILTSAARIVVTSLHGQESYRRFGDSVMELTHFIALGVDRPQVQRQSVWRKTLAINEEAFVLVAAARGVPEKGWAQLIEAFNLATRLGGRDLALICCGEGPAIDAATDFARRAALDNVRFVGFQSEPVHLMMEADCGILLTRFTGETLNLSLIEELSVGIPVIATDIGAISETLSDSQGLSAGALIPLINATPDVDYASAVIRAMAEDPELYGKLKARAESAFAKFEMSTVSELHRLLIQEVIEEAATAVSSAAVH